MPANQSGNYQIQLISRPPTSKSLLRVVQNMARRMKACQNINQSAVDIFNCMSLSQGHVKACIENCNQGPKMQLELFSTYLYCVTLDKAEDECFKATKCHKIILCEAKLYLLFEEMALQCKNVKLNFSVNPTFHGKRLTQQIYETLVQ